VELAQSLAHHRACQAETWESPISPSSSARGTQAGDAVDDRYVDGPERTSVSRLQSCSPDRVGDQQFLEIDAQLAGILGRGHARPKGVSARPAFGPRPPMQFKVVCPTSPPIDFRDPTARQWVATMPSAISRSKDPVEDRFGFDRVLILAEGAMISPLPNARSSWPISASKCLRLIMPSHRNDFQRRCDLYRLPYSIQMGPMQRRDVPLLFPALQVKNRPKIEQRGSDWKPSGPYFVQPSKISNY